MIYVRFAHQIKLAMIKHTLENPSKECGGFIYGDFSTINGDILCDIDAIYYEKRFGSDCEFNFGFSYIQNAKNMLIQLKSKLLMGTYHSHGQYPAFFSDIDRNVLQKYFGINKITIIYSPKYSKLVCEFMNKGGQSQKARIITR